LAIGPARAGVIGAATTKSEPSRSRRSTTENRVPCEGHRELNEFDASLIET
jgi:hypothetical protein